MSGNGKIMCNHGVNLFKCQSCIDDLVAEQIGEQEQRITDLEQQLKTAKVDTLRQIMALLSDVTMDGNVFDAIGKYANNLEGK